MYKVFVGNRRISYEFEINSKYTIINGLSATGKTTLCEMIQDSDNGVVVRSELECVVAAWRKKENIYNTIMVENHKCIIFIDEDRVLGKNCTVEELCNLMKNSDNYYVIFYRSELPIPASIADLIELEYDKRTNTNRFVPKYKVSNIEQSIVLVDRIITEDSKSGNIILKKYFGENVFPVDDGNGNKGGRTLFPRYIRDSEFVGDTLLVYDALSAIWLEDIIVAESTSKKNGNWYRFHPESFERYLLDSPFVKNMYSYDIPDTPVENMEHWYEGVLKKALPLGYNKESTSPCLLYKCGSSGKAVCYSCPNLKFSKDKRDELIHGALSKIRMRDNTSW